MSLVEKTASELLALQAEGKASELAGELEKVRAELLEAQTQKKGLFRSR